MVILSCGDNSQELLRNTQLSNMKRSLRAIHCIPGLTCVINESLYLLTPYPIPQPLPQPLAAAHPLFVSINLVFLDSTYKWDHIVFVFLCLTHFT